MSRNFTVTSYSPGPDAIVRPIVNKLIENGRNINSLSRYERDLLRQHSSAAQFEEYTTPRVAPTPAAQVEKYTPPRVAPASTPTPAPASTPAATPAATNNNGISSADLIRMYQEGLGAGRNQAPRPRTTAEELALERERTSLANSTRLLESQARQQELALQNRGQLALAQLQNSHSLVSNREQAQREIATQIRNQQIRERDQAFQNRNQLQLMREGNALDLDRKTREQALQMEAQRTSLAQTQQARAKERETEAQLQRRQQSTEQGNAMAAYRGL